MLFSNKIVSDEPVRGIKLLVARTEVKDAVFIKGSFLGGGFFAAPGKPMLAELTARVLDEGSRKRNKREIRELFEGVGASLVFSSDNMRTRFSARCLKKDLALVVDILAEILREPALKEREIEIAKKRILTDLEHELEDTFSQGEIRFLRTLYPKGHPNYRADTESAIRGIKKTSRGDVAAFHKNYGLGSLIISAAGDADAGVLSRKLKSAFSGWKRSGFDFVKPAAEARVIGAREEEARIPDKTSADVFIGGPVGINNKHPDFYPLQKGVAILGGTFFARLTSAVREKKGLTYGTFAYLGGASDKADGYWSAWGTFAPSLIEEGRKAIMNEVARFAKYGVKSEEAERFGEALSGLYLVKLSSADGLSREILSIVEQERPISFLDEYPKLINRLGREEINRAVKKRIDMNRIVTVSAGTFDNVS